MNTIIPTLEVSSDSIRKKNSATVKKPDTKLSFLCSIMNANYTILPCSQGSLITPAFTKAKNASLDFETACAATRAGAFSSETNVSLCRKDEERLHVRQR